jgi:hypothetical protein
MNPQLTLVHPAGQRDQHKPEGRFHHIFQSVPAISVPAVAVSKSQKGRGLEGN